MKLSFALNKYAFIFTTDSALALLSFLMFSCIFLMVFASNNTASEELLVTQKAHDVLKLFVSNKISEAEVTIYAKQLFPTCNIEFFPEKPHTTSKSYVFTAYRYNQGALRRYTLLISCNA